MAGRLPFNLGVRDYIAHLFQCGQFYKRQSSHRPPTPRRLDYLFRFRRRLRRSANSSINQAGGDSTNKKPKNSSLELNFLVQKDQKYMRRAEIQLTVLNLSRPSTAFSNWKYACRAILLVQIFAPKGRPNQPRVFADYCLKKKQKNSLPHCLQR